jgi:hypothetical protein
MCTEQNPLNVAPVFCVATLAVFVDLSAAEVSVPENGFCVVGNGGCLLAADAGTDARSVKRISIESLAACQDVCNAYTDSDNTCYGVEWNTVVKPKANKKRWNKKNPNCFLQGKGKIGGSKGGDDQTNGNSDLLCYSSQNTVCAIAEAK